MVRIIEFNNPDVLQNEKTLLSTATVVGATSLTVDSTVDYSVNDLILLGEPGCDGTEVVQISAIPDVNTLTLSAGTLFPHEETSLITRLDFNQARVYKSADDITFVLDSTIDIDYQDHVHKTKFTDTSGLSTDFYRYTFFNSVSSAETAQSKSIAGYNTTEGYISVQQFKDSTGMNFPDALIASAIKTAARQIRLKLYTKFIYRNVSSPNTDHWLQLKDNCDWIADGNLDGKITKDDFFAYEEDPPTLSIPGTRTDVTSDITAINVEQQVISFGTARPTASKTLFIEYYTGPRRLEDMLPLLEEINELLAVNHILKRTPFSALCDGINSWSLNGVSINFSRGELKAIIDDNEAEVRRIIYELQPMRTRMTSMRNRQRRTGLTDFKSSLSFRSNNP